jgi:hypothetical protein
VPVLPVVSGFGVVVGIDIGVGTVVLGTTVVPVITGVPAVITGVVFRLRSRANKPMRRVEVVPVVVITGHGTEANELRARGLGVAGFLRKPLTPRVIVENAERVMRERSETMEAIRQSALALMTPAAATATGAAVAVPEPATGRRESVAKNVALFFAAPFIGLAYFLAVPFIGFYAIGKYGWKALGKSS